jgi:hypothetical protein
MAWSWFRQNGVISSRPPAGNASRWAANKAQIRTMKPSLPIILLLLICVGCTPMSTPTVSLVTNIVPIQPTKSETSAPSQTSTQIPEPTLTDTPIPPATLNAQATLDTLVKVCEEFDSNARGFSQISPDGKWFATSCGSKRNQTLVVQNQEGIKWVFHFADFLSSDFEEMPGSFSVFAWSLDGRFVYFTKSLGYSGGGNQCFPGHGYSGLYRLHLKTGTVTTLISSRDDSFPGDEIRFSPTREYYAVDNTGVTITNLVSGEVTVIDTSGVMEMSWSPDGRFLAFSVAECGETLVESSSISVWDSSTNQTQVLFSTDEMLLRPDSWINNSTLRFEGETWIGNNNLYTLFEYDLAEDKMIFSGTATPRP